MNNKEIINLLMDRLRLPLICGMTFIHNQLRSDISISGQSLFIPDAPQYETVINSFSYTIPCIVIPIFFIVSGYLFFKERIFNEKLYLIKVRKRFWSLLIPYVLWNALYPLIFIFVRIPALHGLFPNISLGEAALPKVLSGYWACEGNDFPLNFSLWYARELVLMVIIPPLPHVVVEKMKACFFIPIVICMSSPLYPKEFEFILDACPFFSLGLCTRLFSRVTEYVERLSFIKYLCLLLITVDLYIVTLGLPINHYMRSSAVSSGILTVFSYVLISVKKGKNGCLSKKEVLFTYTSHGLFITFLQKTALKITRPITEVEFLAIYFLAPILTITISIGMYGCMKRVTPKVLSMLVGGR